MMGVITSFPFGGCGFVFIRQVDIPLPAEQREAFLLALRRDVSWLAGQNLMDYSLGLRSDRPAAQRAGPGQATQRTR